LVFYTYEALRGTPMSMRKMEVAQQVGLMLLMMLMVFAFYNDITNWITNRW
jgi:regulator of sigma E protease